MYVTIWEFSVRPGSESEFEKIYGPEGDWARLFAGGAGYQGTEVLRDQEQGDERDATRYLTIDRWSSAQAFADFRSKFGAQYEKLDARCECLTTREACLGKCETKT
jgi:heme-degrading monooxygenase HmoA